MVNIVSDIRPESPVIGAVPEHIGEGRSSMAESMDEESLHDAFEVMEAPVIHSIGLDRMDHSLLLITKILVNWKEVEDGVDD